MRYKWNFFLTGLVVCFVLLCLCARKKSPEVIVIGTDSLTVEQVNSLDRVNTTDSARIRNVKMRKALASEAIDTKTDSLPELLVKQLQLRAGEEWSREGAQLLLSSAKVLYKKMHEMSSFNDAAVYAESLFSAHTKGSEYGVKAPRMPNDSINFENPEEIAKFLGELFGLSFDASLLLSDFITDQKAGSSEDASEIVKGIVFDEKKEPVEEATKKLKPKKVDNSVKALKYRNQLSIRDSIGKYIPDLKSLYKKYLKMDMTMSGVVYVSFRVDASGKVLSADIKRTEINNEEFLGKLVDYTRTIQFKSIPKHIGNMSFDFPFEFYPE